MALVMHFCRAGFTPVTLALVTLPEEPCTDIAAIAVPPDPAAHALTAGVTLRMAASTWSREG